MRKIKYAVIWFLDELDNALDHIPEWARNDDGKIQRYQAGWGCRLRLATLAYELGERWSIETRPPKRCFWCRKRYDADEETLDA